MYKCKIPLPDFDFGEFWEEFDEKRVEQITSQDSDVQTIYDEMGLHRPGVYFDGGTKKVTDIGTLGYMRILDFDHCSEDEIAVSTFYEEWKRGNIVPNSSHGDPTEETSSLTYPWISREERALADATQTTLWRYTNQRELKIYDTIPEALEIS